MRHWMTALTLSAALALANAAPATVVFTDGFDSGPSPLWGNERGSWVVTGGTYGAAYPANLPPTFTSLPFNLADFAIEFDVTAISDGGVWLRCDFSGGKANGVLLVTGGWSRTGTGLYWHVVHNDSYSGALNEARNLFSQGDNLHIRVEVHGNAYSAFLNGAATPATTLTTSDFPTGRVGLYDFSSQSFDNVRVEVVNPLVGLNNRAASDTIMATANANFLFTFFGTAATVDANTIILDDGAGVPIRIIAPGYSGLSYGDYVRATGLVTDLPGQPTLTTTSAGVTKLR